MRRSWIWLVRPFAARRLAPWVLFCCLVPLAAAGQQGARPQSVMSGAALPPAAVSPGAVSSGPEDYVVAPEDLLRISVYGAPDMGATVRVSTAGAIQLPLLGLVHAAGLSVAALSQELAADFDRRYLQNAQVSILVEEFHGQPLVVTGAVHNPGVLELTQPIPVADAIARSGGLTDVAGDVVVLSGPGVPDHKIPVRQLLDPSGPDADPMVHGGMTITVPPAGLVYVVGAVNRAGGFPIRNNQVVTVLQALALAQGLSPTAAQNNARLITAGADGSRRVERLDLGKIMRGKAPDPILASNAIVVVPDSTGKVVVTRSLDASIAILIGGLTYGRF